MAARSLDLLINVQAGTIISAFDSTVQGNIPGFVFGDSTPVSVRLVEPSGVQVRPWKEIDLTGQSVRIGIGIPGASPTAGAYTLTYGEDTTAALAYNATATQIAAALNALPSITSAGGIAITSTANAFKVIFESNGARTALTADTGSLSPTSGAYISTVLEGANDAAAIYLVKLEAMPAAYEELADNLPPAAINVATVREGAVGVAEIQTLSLDPLPHDGTYTLSVAGQETSSLSYDSAATDIQSALELLSGIGTGNVTVSGEFPAFTITFAASRGNVGTMVGNASALTVPTGRRGILSNNTTGIAELLASRARVDAMLEIEITDNISGETWTPLQAQCVVREDVIPASPASQTPMPVFLTEFMVVNRFLAFDAAQTLSPTQKTQAAENLGLGTAATADTGTAEGEIPLLGAGGKLASSLLPSLSLTDIIAVADQAARLALVSADAYGKIVKQADNGRSYALPTGAAAATAGNWIELGDAAITAADIQDSTSAGRDLLTAPNAAAQVALIGAETPAGAQAKADAAQAAAIAATAKTYNVISYGATADGITDDSGAINLALEDCYNAGGGTVYFPAGTYKISGAFDGNTKSVLKLPNAGGYSGAPRTVRIVGESRGRRSNNHSAIAPGGVTLDCTSLVGVAGDAVFAGAPLVTPNFGGLQTQWNNVDVHFDDMMIVLPPNPTVSGLFLGNCTRAKIGDNLSVIALAGAGSWAEPTGYSTGIFMPQILNNINLEVGACQVVGFLNGIIPGEHTTFRRPAIAYCKSGLKFQSASHLISGVLNLENCTLMVDTGSVTGGSVTVDLTLEIEQASAGNWWSTASTISDASNSLRGNIAYSSFDIANDSGSKISVTGGLGVKYRNLRAIDITVVANAVSVQSIPSGGAGTKVLFANEQLDTAGVFTASRFQPTHAGWFDIRAAVELLAVPPNTYVAMFFALTTNNGASTNNLIAYEHRVGGGAFTGKTMATGNRLLPFNGTTDYLEVFVFQDSGGSIDTENTPDTVFQAVQQDVAGVHY